MYNPWQEKPAYRFTRTYANALTVLGVALWIVAIAIGVAMPTVGLRGITTEALQRLLPDGVSVQWTVIPAVIIGFLLGGILSGPLIIGGRLCKILLDHRDTLLALGERTESLEDNLARLNRTISGGFLDRYARVQTRAESAEQECERLRDEVSQLQAEIERHRREREELAEALSRIIKETLLRLRGQRA